MNPARHMSSLRAACFAASLFSGVQAFAQTPVELRPNLQPLPAWNISLSSGLLSFNTTSWNNGGGPLELLAGQVDSHSKRQKVYQRIYFSDGTFRDHLAGDFMWHKLHNHFHFEQYALYVLKPVNAPGASQRTSQKTTFCVMDTDAADLTVSGAPSSPVYSTCGNVKQGMSVGWADTYGSYLAGQAIDVSGLPDGIYNLVITVDPQTRLLEVAENDNTSCVTLDLRVSTSSVTVLDDTGCSVAPPPSTVAVDSITPSVIVAGSIANVLITGGGFTPGMPVSFVNGSGQRPIASNVRVLDTTSLTATVSVKKGGSASDSVWDVRVGAGTLVNGLTVTR